MVVDDDCDFLFVGVIVVVELIIVVDVVGFYCVFEYVDVVVGDVFDDVLDFDVWCGGDVVEVF